MYLKCLVSSSAAGCPHVSERAPGVAFKTNLPQHLSAQQDEDDEWGYDDEYEEDEDHAKDLPLDDYGHVRGIRFGLVWYDVTTTQRSDNNDGENNCNSGKQELARHALDT